MQDRELEEIRNRRLQELQQQHKLPQQYGGLQNEQLKKQQEEAREKQEEYRNIILSQILTQEARTRLNIIKVAKPENGRMVEDFLINNARINLIRSKISEEDLKKILEQIKSRTKQTKVSFERKRVNFDSDDDD